MSSLNIAFGDVNGVEISSYHGEKVNALKIDVRGMTLWFSYNTPIAFRYKANLYISENCWQNTTGKHISEVERICGKAKKDRLPRVVFEELLSDALERAGLGRLRK